MVSKICVVGHYLTFSPVTVSTYIISSLSSLPTNHIVLVYQDGPVREGTGRAGPNITVHIVVPCF